MDRIDADNWSAKDVARLLALVESEKRYYQDILTMFPVPAAVVARDLSFLSVNREFRKRFLAHLPEESAHRAVDVLHATVIREHIVPAFDRATSAHNAAITVLDEKGVAGSWMLDAIPLPDVHHDSPRETLLVLRSVVQGDSGLARVLDQSSTVVWKLDPATGEIEFGNQAAYRVFGLGVFKNWTRRVHPDDERRVSWVYEAVTESGKEASVEYRLQRPDQSTVWVADHIVPVHKQGAKTELLHVVTTLQADRRASTADMVQAREMAASARLARQVAHEFNNLWMIVNGYAEVLEDRADAESRASLEEIARAARRGMETTRQLLEFARPPAAHVLAFDLHKELPTWDLDADLHLPPGVAPVSADPERLNTALVSLIEFARERSGVDLRLRIDTVRDTRLSDFAAGAAVGPVVVLRLGPIPNIQPSTVDHWCEPFFTETEKVVPIGLAATYMQLRQMGAAIRLQPGPNQDGTFLISLPLARLPEPAKPKPVEPVPAHAPGSRETVLVTDSEESIRALVGRVLEKEGYRVLMAATAADAALSLQNEPQPVTLLITDIQLDDARGQELAGRLRVSLPDLRVLFISSLVDDPAFLIGELPPGEGFLQKPFTIASLSSMVRTVLDSPKN
ncbi:MAG: response regulator [Acidobacteria bacterium]|nr:response regulator [Acidobacteriota bacterium]